MTLFASYIIGMIFPIMLSKLLTITLRFKTRSIATNAIFPKFLISKLLRALLSMIILNYSRILWVYAIPMHIVNLITVAMLLLLNITKNVKMSRVLLRPVHECFIFMMAIIWNWYSVSHFYTTPKRLKRNKISTSAPAVIM